MPGCRDQPREWRAFACGGHVAGRIEADLLDFERGAYVLDTAAIRRAPSANT